MSDKRRSFIKTMGVLTTAAVCGGGSFLIQSCSSYRSLTFENMDNKIKVPRLQLAKNKDGVINFFKLPAPIYLKEHGTDNYSAVLLECTHKGCEVSPTGKILICPCHGSEFSDRGKVLSAPSETDLYRFKVTFDNENIYISLVQ